MDLKHNYLLTLLIAFLAAVVAAEEKAGNSKEASDVIFDCCNDKPIKKDRVQVPLGYLTAVKGQLYNRQVFVSEILKP